MDGYGIFNLARQGRRCKAQPALCAVRRARRSKIATDQPVVFMKGADFAKRLQADYELKGMLIRELKLQQEQGRSARAGRRRKTFAKSP